MQFASWKEHRAVAAALKPVYQAEAAAVARGRLADFDRGPWGQKYPAIARSWRRNWEQVIPFFAFATELRKILYTTNAIESLNAQVRKAVRVRGHFPSRRPPPSSSGWCCVATVRCSSHEASFELVERTGPVLMEKAQENAVGEQVAAGLAWRTVIGLVRGAADSLNPRATRGHDSPQRAWTAMSGRKAT
jgi:Transposase, Mutator family